MATLKVVITPEQTALDTTATTKEEQATVLEQAVLTAKAALSPEHTHDALMAIQEAELEAVTARGIATAARKLATDQMTATRSTQEAELAKQHAALDHPKVV